MLKSSLCDDYSDAYILVKGKITIAGRGADAAARQADERDKSAEFKNCAPFINCISEINNTQVDNPKDIDTIMPIYNLIEYSDNYAKTSGSLWQYYRDETNNNLEDSESFKSKIKTRIYLSKPELLVKNQNLNHLVEPSFQGVNRLFVLAFENNTIKTSYSGYYRPNVEITDYNIMINGENFFDQPIINNKVTYENIRKIATGQGDDYTTGCLLDYPYVKDAYKMIAIDLSKQQALDSDPRANQQINFTASLDRAGNTRINFILEEAKETILDFSQRL